MFKSKWYYMWCGASIFGALVGAVMHSLFLSIWGVGFAIYYWYTAEARYAEELKQYAKEIKNEEFTTDSEDEK